MLFLPLTFIFVILCFILIYNKKTTKNLPPGPASLPLIGNLHNIGPDIKAAFHKWRIEYGDLVGFQLGIQQSVVISDFDTFKLIFKGDKVSGRPKATQEIFNAYFQTEDSEKSIGIVFSEGNQWKEQRRFALKTLRDFGFGKSSMQSVINEEVTKLVEELKCFTGKPIVMANRTNLAVGNSIWKILNGKKCELQNPKMEQALRGTTKFHNVNSVSGLLMAFPMLRHLPIIRGLFNKSRKFLHEMKEVTSEAIQNHFNTYQVDNQRDFIDSYIKKINETEDTNSSFHNEKGVINMQQTIIELFGASTVSTTDTLCFAILYLIRWPQVQRKLQREIDTVIGSRRPVLEDMQSMPYTEAVIEEVLRFSSVVFIVSHATSEEIQIAGYTIPSGTAVYANIWWIHNNPNYWDNPEQFNPERFLQDGKFVKNKHCIPFMIGKRSCPGQSLAQHQIFLFLTGLFQHFSFLTPGSDCTKVNTEPHVGLLHFCPEYEVVLQERCIN